jgi:hypothetical protein
VGFFASAIIPSLTAFSDHLLFFGTMPEFTVIAALSGVR